MTLQTEFKHPLFDKPLTAALQEWEADNKIERLWKADASLWTNADEAKWLGWLSVIAKEQQALPALLALKKTLSEAGITNIVLLGMGGSSLCPAMLASTFGQLVGNPALHIVDSTDPQQIRHLEETLDFHKTLFIVSSKSGSTLEPTLFKEYFYAKTQIALGREAVGDHFIAITDPGSKLEASAKLEHFRAILPGETSIGGRYSALSNFGIVPAVLMGIPVESFLQKAENMRQACLPSKPIAENPGVMLGLILGLAGKQGKDKITLLVSPAIQTLGAWLEQLLAESTGKMGIGLIPVDQEPLGDLACYGQDRLFIYIRLASALDQEQEKKVLAFATAGHPVVSLTLTDKWDVAGEFFRWEMATAVAGSVLGINPFDQPDVEESKVLAIQCISEYEKTGVIPKPPVLFKACGIELSTDAENAKAIQSRLIGEPSLASLLKAHLNRVIIGDYVNLSAFIEMSDLHMTLLQNARVLIRDAKKVATCLGFGPRFLHSTGQAYKGGPNSGVFLQITASEGPDLQIPGRHESFGLVIQAQAEADFSVLSERKRRVLRIHLGQNVEVGLQELQRQLAIALEQAD